MVYFFLGVLIGFFSAFYLLKSLCPKKPQFAGKTVLVTGASSGIGKQVCYELSRLGANLVLCSRKKQDLMLVQKNLVHPLRSSIFVLDMNDPEKVFSKTSYLMQNFEEQTGFQKLDILVLNAGICQRQEFDVTDLKVFDEIMRVNFNSCVTMTQAILPFFKAQKQGQIVATSSVFGLHAAPKRTAYSASKHALNGFLNSLHPQIEQYNISISVICPGKVATNISKRALKGDGSKYKKDDNANGMSSQKCAKEFVEAVYWKETQRTIGTWYEKLRVLTSRISSSAQARLGRKLYKIL